MRRALTISTWPCAAMAAIAVAGLMIGCSSDDGDTDVPVQPNPCADAGTLEFERCDVANADPNGPVINGVSGPACARTTEASTYSITFAPPASPIVGIAVSGQAQTGPKDPYESRWPADTPPRNPFLYLFGPTRTGEARLSIQFIDEQNRYGPALCANVSVR